MVPYTPVLQMSKQVFGLFSVTQCKESTCQCRRCKYDP